MRFNKRKLRSHLGCFELGCIYAPYRGRQSELLHFHFRHCLVWTFKKIRYYLSELFAGISYTWICIWWKDKYFVFCYWFLMHCIGHLNFNLRAKNDKRTFIKLARLTETINHRDCPWVNRWLSVIYSVQNDVARCSYTQSNTIWRNEITDN